MNQQFCNNSFRLLICLAVASFAGCDVTITNGGSGVSTKGVQGSGVEKTETREVAEFDSVKLFGAGTVEISQGDERSLAVTADDNLIELIDSTVTDGVLSIKPTEPISPKTNMKFVITTPSLSAVEIDGAANVKLGDIKGEDLSVTLNGAAQIEGDGSVTNLILEINGAGSASLSKFETKSTIVKISGASNATVFASESVDAEINGLGNIKVHGNPTKKKKEVNGLGKVSYVD